MGDEHGQESLFDLPPRELEPAPFSDELRVLATELPQAVRLGGMSWSYEGWRSHVYSTHATRDEIARDGLTAYAKHPLFRLVEIDRSYYDPLPERVFSGFSRQVPEDFRFVVKAHEDCVVESFPHHARYGKRRGEVNARFLDASYTEEHVVLPTTRGLGAKLGALLFQFPQQDASQPARFAARLHDFLRRLPKTTCYAVELRNPELVTREYTEALVDTGAVHCHNAWTQMPDVFAQARTIPPRARSPLVIRWMLRRGEAHADAQARFGAFDRIVDEDVATRRSIARLVAKADLHGVPCLVLVDNKAEGCAPESIALLARAIVDERHALPEG